MMSYTPPVTDDVKRETLEAYEATGSVTKTALALGISRKAASKRLKRWGIKTAAYTGQISNPPLPSAAIPPDGFVVRRNAAEFDADGALKRQWVETAPGGTEMYQVPANHVVKGESALVDGNGMLLARWIKTRDGAVGAGLVEAFQEAFKNYEGGAPAIPAPYVSDDDMLSLYCLPDLHFGMMAWNTETKGGDYDIDIATETALKSIETLVARSQPSKHAVLLGLGDMFHADDQKNVTPGSGHQLDLDGRHAKVFAAGAKLVLRMVEIIATKHEFIEVRFVPGNHDITSATCLTVALGMFYSGHDRITVNTDPGIAWYRLHGQCLLGATHGHTMKLDRMPGIMAVDRAEDWGKAKYRNMFVGHFHSETSKEISGVRVEVLQSPAARDAWNSASGYRSGRSLSVITFHKTEGEIQRHRVNLG
jgi:hypothetical protein